MNLFNSLSASYIQKLSILFLFVSFIFLFGLKFDHFQFRFLILILLFPCVYKLFKDINLKKYNFIIFFISLFLCLFFHTGLNIYYEKVKLTQYSLFGHLFLLSIFTISYYYFEYINKNINFIITFFLIIFFLSCLYSIFNYRPDAPYFCGGIPRFFLTDTLLDKYYERTGDVRFSFKELIFNENSHLGMVAPGILSYSIYKITTQKTTLLYKSLIFIFFIICFIKSSTTLLVGTVLSLVFLIIFSYRSLKIKTIFTFLILVCIFSASLLSSKECRSRFVPIYNTIYNSPKNEITPNYTKSNKHHEYLQLDEKDVIEGYNKNFVDGIRNLLDTNGSLSSGIYFHALTIAKKSIIEKPFGWGLNRYDKAFDYFNKTKTPKQTWYQDYNNKDGTNNFVKLSVEFGVFATLFYLFVFLFVRSNKISIELKLFYLPFIITQSLRGSGYFNGGFLLIILLMLFTYINVYKKNI